MARLWGSGGGARHPESTLPGASTCVPNLSERGVRPLKTQQKISGRLTSDDVTQDRLDIRGYLDTARKHGLGAYETLHQLMLGNPWMPPAQPISP